MNLSPEILHFIEEHENDNIRLLALSGKKYPCIDIPIAIEQIQGRQIARSKIPTWYENKSVLYPRHLSMEQSSSEYTARYKASLCTGNSFADLTGGLGIDFYFISQSFGQATYIEQQPELVSLASHNFNALKLKNYNVINQDAKDYLQSMDKIDMIYLDPARRDNVGRKIFRIEDCTPNVVEIEKLLDEKADCILIKFSPMLDISMAIKSINNITDVHIVSYMNECKELIFVKGQRNSEIKLHCINISNSKTDCFIFTKEEEEQQQVTYTNTVGKYLYEPNASIIKAGAYKSVVQEFCACKLHVNSHLYTSDEPIPDFYGRIFSILNVCSPNRKELKLTLGNNMQANLSIRNFPSTIIELKKKLGIKDGGDIYIFATTLADEKKVLIICKKVD